MADKSHPEPVDTSSEEFRQAERRAFLGRAAAVGLPAILATVQPRAAWAGDHTGSKVGSVVPSAPNFGTGWRTRKRDPWDN